MTVPALDLQAAGALVARPGVAALLEILDRDGEETRIVGGAVRNALIGRPVHEIDLATTALPAEITRRLRTAGYKAVPTGIEHGTVTAVVDGESFEVTTLREDVETDGRHAVVRFGRDFAADALRRDFTVNALSVGRDGRIHDETNGMDDLGARRVRFIGEARERIREDFLRTLRFFRFTAEYAEGPVDGPGLDAAIRERDGLDTLSRERVRAELFKLVAARRGRELLGMMSDASILGRLVGGVVEIGRLQRAASSESTGPDATHRLGAALVTTREDADRLRERLRLSNAEHDRLAAYAEALSGLRSAEPPLHAADVRRAAVTYGLGPLADALACLAGEPRPVLSDDGRAQAERFRSGVEASPVFPLAGADLVREGVAPGPEIGRRLAQAKRDWMVAGCPTEWAFKAT